MPPLGESGSRNLYKILDVVTFLQLLHIFFFFIYCFVLEIFSLKTVNCPPSSIIRNACGITHIVIF